MGGDPVPAPTLDQDQAGNTETGTPQSRLHFGRVCLVFLCFQKESRKNPKLPNVGGYTNWRISLQFLV